MIDSFREAAAAVARPIQVQSHRLDGLWRQDLPTLEEATGRLTQGGMWEHQRRWWELKNFIKVLVGGYGSGKTLIGSKRIIALALQNAPMPVAFISPTFPMARKTTIPTIEGLLAGKQTLYGSRAFWWRHNKSLHEFRVRFRGREGNIHILSGEDPLSLRGSNLAAAGIDEPFIQNEEVFKQVVARVRAPEAPSKEIFLTGTPEQLNWGYELCVGSYKEKFDVGYVTASTDANKALDPNYVARLLSSLSPEAAEAYIGGAFRNLASGQVYYSFHDGNIAELPFPEVFELGAGMDFNVNPMSAAVFWTANNHIHYFDEIELPNADTEFLCSVLKERYVTPPFFKKRELQNIYPDATGANRSSKSPGGKSDFTYIRSAGFNVVAKSQNPLRRDRYNAVNGKLKSSTGSVTLTISPKCKKLCKYLGLYTYQLMNKQQDMSHLLDAFSYPIAYLFPVVKESVSMHRFSGA